MVLGSKKLPVVVALVWTALVVGALVSTLQSLRTEDFDGLNNLLQIPLALPWFLIMPAVGSNVVDAWVVAGLGMVNGAFLVILVTLAQRRRIENR